MNEVAWEPPFEPEVIAEWESQGYFVCNEHHFVSTLNAFCPHCRLDAALTLLREIAEGKRWENPPKAAERFLDEIKR